MHCLWPKQRENILAKTSMALKPRIFSPANLSPSTVIIHIAVNVMNYLYIVATVYTYVLLYCINEY